MRHFKEDFAGPMTDPPYKNRNAFVALSFTILAVWRGWNLWHRGILDHDEGHALLNANTWHQIMRWALAGGLWRDGSESIAALRDALHQQGGTLYAAGKFGYSLILATVALPGHVTTGLALTLAWLCGIVVCVLAGVLTWQYSGSRRAGEVAVLGCIVSPLLCMLSREVSGTIWALMFGLAGACALQAGTTAASAKRRWMWGILGGLCLGYGFTCHFNLAPFILAVFLATGYSAVRTATGLRKIPEFIKAVLPAALASLFVLFAFEAVTSLVKYRLRGVYPEYMTFFGELDYFLGVTKPMYAGVRMGDGAVGWGWDAWMVYIRVAAREGLVWFALVSIGVPWLAWRNRGDHGRLLRPAILLFVPLLFWLAYVYRVERVLGMCVAAFWVLSCAAMARYLRMQSSPPSKHAYLLPVLLGVQIMFWVTEADDNFSRQQSTVPDVARETLKYVKAHGGEITAGSFDTGYAPLWKWTIVEQMRKPEFQRIRSNIDFSRFAGSSIVFIDPATWSHPGSTDFTITKEQALHGRIIEKRSGIIPPIYLETRDLRLSELPNDK